MEVTQQYLTRYNLVNMKFLIQLNLLLLRIPIAININKLLEIIL